MNRAITFLSTSMLLFCLRSSAQKWNVSLGLGLATNTVAKQIHNGYGTISGVYGLEASRNLGRTELGISVKCLPLVSEGQTFYTSSSANPANETTYRLYYAKKALAITPFLNYKILTGSNIIYVGVNAGIAPTFTAKKENLGLYNNSGVIPETLEFSYNSGLAFTAGTQMGYRRMLSERVFVEVNLLGNYFTARIKNTTSFQAEAEQVNILYFTGMIRIGYRF